MKTTKSMSTAKTRNRYWTQTIFRRICRVDCTVSYIHRPNYSYSLYW